MAAIDWTVLEPLVIRARHGDRAAFDELYTKIWDSALGFVLSRYGRKLSREDAEDVLQLALITAWRELPHLTKTSSFKSWFFTILARKCMAACRIASTRALFAESDGSHLDSLALLAPELADELASAEGQRDPYRHLVQSELVTICKTRIKEVFDALTPVRKKVFVGRFLNLYDEVQIAQTMNIPIGTVRSATAAIVQHLRRELRTKEFDGIPIADQTIAFTKGLAEWQRQLSRGIA